MSKVIAIGNALVDVMTLLDSDLTLSELSIPKGSMQLVDLKTSEEIQNKTKNLKKSLACGGSAANTIRALACLKADSCFIGKVGNDEYGQFYISDMQNSGAKTNIVYCKEPTGKAVALISPDAQRTFATFLGAAGELTENDINPEIFYGYNIFYVEGYLVYNHNFIEKAIRTAKEAGLTIALDLASYNVVEDNLDFLKEISKKYVDIIFSNEEESKAFSGFDDPYQGLKYISDFCKIAIVKVGKNGSYIKKGDFECHEPALNYEALDSTGAGDFFAAGFLYGLINGYPLEISMKFATILAGNVMEFIGPKLDEKRWNLVVSQINQISSLVPKR